MTEETFDNAGQGTDLALPGDMIRKRHIATRASNKRRIIVLTAGDSEFEGYSIGLDAHSLQILELPSGEVSSVALDYIVAISDGKPFSELDPDQKNTVERRTASFRKTSQTWLVTNWPDVYDRRDDDDGHFQNRQRINRRPPRPSLGYGRVINDDHRPSTTEGMGNGDSQVRD